MIKLNDARLTDSIPRIIGKEPWAKAMSYAVNRQIKTLLKQCENICLYGSIRTLPESILDIIAVDLDVRGYNQEFSIETKRQLIIKSISYWNTAGTAAVVYKICRDIYDDATIEEWYEYGGEPGHFKVKTSYKGASRVDELTLSINDVKRLSAWLDEVQVMYNVHLYFEPYTHSQLSAYTHKQMREEEFSI